MKRDGIKFAKGLRRKQTEAERRLWMKLRDRQIDGWKFRRQVPYGPYVLDFLCIDGKLVVEVDGYQHFEDRTASDAVRTAALAAAGLRVLRLTNADVIKDMPAALENIYRALGQRQAPSPGAALRQRATERTVAAPTSPQGERRFQNAPTAAESQMPKMTQRAAFEGFADPKVPLGPGDIVIIGAGLAGLFTALRLAPLPVTVVAAAPLGEGASSSWAQGGIAAAVGEGDTPAAHARDTIAAGAGLVDEDVAHFVAEEAPDRVRDLLAYGVPFDRNLEGHYVLSREAAHTAKRIVRISGDRAGHGIMQALIAAVRKSPQIRVLESYEAEDLVVENGRVTGVRLIEGTQRGNGSYELIPAAAVVLATGGASALYAVTTNPVYARGEAIAFAARAGAVIADAEFVQFHPTAIDAGTDPAPLATEALRGEGAILINSAGERFMKAVHNDAELAPRDVVARAVFAEITAGRGAFLDCRHEPGARIKDAFPTVYAFCRDNGIDPVTEPIPVAPAAHYHMGGVATGQSGRTSIEGLWAAGEVASTGLHGANRLASNSLLEAAVFGARVASDIQKLVPASHAGPIARLKRVGGTSPLAADERAALVRELRLLMTAHAGVVRNAAGLEQALNALADLGRRAEGDSVLTNMILAARFIAGAALMRKESRGGHFRTDFPKPAKSSARSFLTLADIRRAEKKVATKARSAALRQTHAACLRSPPTF